MTSALNNGKALLTFVSNTSIDVPSTKIIDDIIIDMSASIIYRFEGQTEWLSCKGNEFIESQTLNIVHMDEHNKVIQTNNIPGKLRVKEDITYNMTSEVPSYCTCAKCIHLMGNYNHIEDEVLETIAKQEPIVEQQKANEWHVEQKKDIVDVIVIDDDNENDNKPIIIQQVTTNKKVQKRVRWQDRLDNLHTTFDEEASTSAPLQTYMKESSNPQIKREYRRNLRRHTLRRSSRLAEK